MQKIAMAHADDPRAHIWKEIGDISKLEVFNTQVLVAVYIRPEKTKGGIILTDRNRDEDRHQSKVGMILKMGHKAFVDPKEQWFAGASFSVGDWIVFRPSDGWGIGVNGYYCRMLEDVSVKMRIPHPDAVW